MVGQNEQFLLFEQCKVCIICSKDLSPDTAHQVHIAYYFSVFDSGYSYSV